MIRMTPNTVPLSAALLAAWLAPTAQASMLFWMNDTTDRVFSSDSIDGSDEQLIRDFRATTGLTNSDFNMNSIAVDGDRLYIAEDKNDRIFWSEIDNVANRSNLVRLDAVFGNANYRPNDLAVDADYIFWTDGVTQTIYRADIDGTNAQVIGLARSGFSPGTFISWDGLNTDGLTLAGEKVYWTSSNNDAVYIMNRDGSDFDKLINMDSALGSRNYNPQDITNDGSSLFWADTDEIYRANIDGTGVELLIDLDDLGVGTGVARPRRLAEDLLVPLAEFACGHVLERGEFLLDVPSRLRHHEPPSRG
ncbi:MAG: hypothetical protein AAGI30_04415 [Planctomycetota bacterium]